MANWREELTEAVKTKSEREAEEAARQRQRVAEALGTAETAFGLASTALEFARDAIQAKGREVSVEASDTPAATEGDAGTSGLRLRLGDLSLGLELDRNMAVLRVHYADAKPREFDFARERHVAATDVEEYVGRRILELVRSSQKVTPW